MVPGVARSPLPIAAAAARRAIAIQASAAALLSTSSTTNPSTPSSRKPPIPQTVKFIDQLRVVARGGQGGGGSSALFGRTGHHPRAAGGNGAPGGGVVLRATRQLTGLGSIPLRAEGGSGGHGGKQWMDGRRGADKVVPVPLGTMVWRLVQLQGSGAATPHGVTALPAAQPQLHQDHQQLQQQQQQQQAQQQHVNQQQQQQQQCDACGDVASSHQRRQFFPCSPQLPSAGAAADAEAAGNTSSASSSSSTSDSDWLYEQLVGCGQQLSNAEKLNLLHFGALEGPAAARPGLDAGSESEGEGDDWDEEEGLTEAEGSGLDDDEQQQQQQQQQQQLGGVDAWVGLGKHGPAWERHFSKQQVWSILEAQAELLGVLEEEGQELAVAAGGRGGRGNAAAPSKHQRPAVKTRSDGQPGQEVLLMLKLRLMADVVLVGLPNVGKSSLIAALTSARAQVGSYAFTTLRPQLGTLTASSSTPADVGSTAWLDGAPAAHGAAQGGASAAADDTGGSQAVRLLEAAAAAAGDGTQQGLTGHRLVLADLPGLVPGAHAGRGRGTDFLKHLGKARCIALVLDMTGRDGSQPSQQQQHEEQQQTALTWDAVVPHSPEQQLVILQEELRQYNPHALAMPSLVVANKLDALSPADASAALAALKRATQLPIVPVSAKQGLGLRRLKDALEAVAGAAPAA